MPNIKQLFATGKGLLLACGVVLFNIASAYTTKRGLDLMFRDDKGLGGMLPWILAIGCAAFLILLTFEIATRRKGARIGDVVMAYIVIASFSIFFNFSFIYSNLSGRAVESSLYQRSNSTLDRVVALAKEKLSNYFEIPKFEQELAAAKVNRDFEKDRNDRPGEGQRWLPLEEQVRSLSSKLDLQRRRFDEAFAPIKKIEERSGRKNENSGPEQARQASREVLAQIRQVQSRLEAYGLNAEVDIRALEDEAGSGTIEHSLHDLFAEVGKFIEGKLDSLDTYRFILSLFLSVVLDTALFIVVAVQRPQIQAAEATAGSSEKKLWDEKMW